MLKRRYSKEQIALVLMLGLLLPSLLSAEEAKQVLYAGAAKANITPPLGESIVGGFSPFPATNIHDELHARCLILDDGKTTIGFVICDSLGIKREVFDEARKLIAAETEIPAANILMAATHTHSATPATSEKYSGFLARRIADALRRAIANKQPAQIGWGSVDEPSEVFVRRWYVTDKELLRNPFGSYDQVRMNPPANPALLVRQAAVPDPEVSFLVVRTITGEPISLLANYSLHYVGGVNKGDVSADYFGIFSEELQKRLEPDAIFPTCVAMMSNGTSGDVNNINFPNRGPSYRRYEKMQEVALKLVEKVFAAQQQVEMQDSVELAAASRELTLKIRKPDAAMQAYLEQIATRPDTEEPFHRYEKNYAGRVQRILEGPDEISIPLQVLQVGNLAVSAIPFEVFAEIGLELKEKTPFSKTFTIELANDWHGYLPTPAQHKLGGYETWLGTNKVEYAASDKIIANLLEMMQELKAKSPEQPESAAP